MTVLFYYLFLFKSSIILSKQVNDNIIINKLRFCYTSLSANSLLSKKKVKFNPFGLSPAIVEL